MRKLKRIRKHLGALALAAIAVTAPVAAPVIANTAQVMASNFTPVTVGGVKYEMFVPATIVIEGQKTKNEPTIYYINGKKLSGWQNFYIDAKTKIRVYLKNGAGQTGWFFDGTKYVYVKDGKVDSSKKKTGWVSVSGKSYYIKNNVAYTGWKQMGKAEGEKTSHWSFFDKKTGALYTGWHKMGKTEGEKTEHWSYFGDNGWLRTGWQQLGKGTENPDGNNIKHWSYFGDNGWLRTGWVQLGKGTSEPDGNKAKHWSYFGDNGWLRTGWVQLGKGTSEPDGNKAKHWSYFGDNGWLTTGWKYLTKANSGEKQDHFSYFGTNGWLRTGLITLKKGTANPDGNNPEHKSYFDSKGWLVVNKAVTTGGKNYWANNLGWLTEKKVEKITTGLRAKATNGSNIYYSKIEGKVPQMTITGTAFNAHQMAKTKGAKVAIDAGMIFGTGNYYSYGKLWTNYYGNQCGDTLVLRKDGWLDSLYVTPSNVKSLGIEWAVKGLNCYTRDGKRTAAGDVGYNPYSFIAQDYDGNYYIGAFNNANFTVMHNSLKKIIPNLKFMYATEGGGHSKYIENGNLVFNGRGQSSRTTPGLIWFK